tara:strand:- start:371 stop:574 length:204 start_codon:yes stop_codon:yes gene_type:complete
MGMTEPQQFDINEEMQPKYVLEVKHMKSGSNLVLCISKLRVSGDNLDEVMADLQEALEQYLNKTDWA